MLLAVTEYHCNFCTKLIFRLIPRIISPITVFESFPDRSVLGPSSRWCLRWGMPPRILPVPPRRGRALPPILVISFILLILEATQGRQCFFEVSSMPHGHRDGTNKIRTYPPIVTIYIEFFFGSVVCDSRSPICPSRESLLQRDPFRSWSFGILHHGWNDRECSRILFSCISFWVDSQWSTSDPLLSSRVGDRVVDLSLCSSGESKRGQELTWCTSCSLSYHLVRSDRTCSRRCRRPSTTHILCTVLWVQHRVVHTIQCFQLL